MTNEINVRELALDALIEITENQSYSHTVLRQALKKYQFLSKQDRSLMTKIVEGTLEYLIQIDFVINQYSKIKADKMKPFIRNLLRMSVYQIIYLERIPDSAVCNEAVKLAAGRRFTGLKGFVNGVLRTISRNKQALAASFTENWIKYSIPKWLYELWTTQLGEAQTLQMLPAFLENKATMVRCNLSLASRAEISESLSRQGVKTAVHPCSEKVLILEGYNYLEELQAFSEGLIQVQDITSVLAGEGACLKSGDVVLDVCAAPGGKSLHMADRLKGSGMVEARDLTPAKLALIEENIRRSGFKNIRVQQQDATVFDPSSAALANVVLADVPCSGLGIIGKKPDIKLQMNPEKIHSLVQLQREILTTVWPYVKPGGELIYSTCTVNRQENEQNIDWFLEQFPFERVDLRERFAGRLKKETMKDGFIQFLPGEQSSDGFFMAVLKRRGTA